MTNSGESSGVQLLKDLNRELTQKNKMYQRGFEYLVDAALNILEKEDLSWEAESLANEVVKVFQDVNDHDFKL